MYFSDLIIDFFEGFHTTVVSLCCVEGVRNSTKMASVNPINAHQQSSIPLLRRPRAPKPIKIERAEYKKTSENNYHLAEDNDHETLDTAELGYLTLEEPDGRSNFVIHSLYPRGPEFFPPGNVLHSYNAVPVQPPVDGNVLVEEGDIYDLQAWLPPRPILRTSQPGVMLSRQNYKKLTGWFATHVPKQENLNTVQFDLEAGPLPTRKPAQQAIIGKCIALYDCHSRGYCQYMIFGECLVVYIFRGGFVT